ncbi:MAG: SPOR domain-containing protein [Alphaproteobacteria bacterium]|nr:SPOR domain-containing protein [Alphaproteobacteria bacterium]
MSEDKELELLDLDDDMADEGLPEATSFVTPRPHRPWLLLAIGVAIIVLAVFIIVRVVSNNSSSSIEIDLGAPVMVEEREPDVIMPAPRPMPTDVPQPVQQVPGQVTEPVPAPAPVPQPVVQPVPQPVQVAPAPVPQPVVQPVPVAPQQNQNVRVVQDRKEVTFNPERATATPKSIPAPSPKEVKTPTKPKPAPKPVAQKVANGGWYVQFGSYGTRAAAEAAEKKIRSGHQNLFAGKQFVILAAVLPNGTTTYRLRIAFASSGDANGFCRNAKSDGLDCYVAK